MRKSVLVIDTPENCLDCQFCYELDDGVEAYCSISDDDKDTSIMKKLIVNMDIVKVSQIGVRLWTCRRRIILMIYMMSIILGIMTVGMII